MKTSEFDGQRVVYVDNMGLQHTGAVVGQSNDGTRILVQSDRLELVPAAWHFSVGREVIAGVLEAPAPEG